MKNRMTEMSELSILTMALLAGVFLGVIFYGGLWWTVRRSVSSKSLNVWLIGSFPVRAIIAVSGFYLVSRGDWRSLLICLAGFLVARICVTRLLRAPHERNNRCVRGTES
jgi:F1F0 ATPase subunit 2